MNARAIPPEDAETTAIRLYESVGMEVESTNATYQEAIA